MKKNAPKKISAEFVHGHSGRGLSRFAEYQTKPPMISRMTSAVHIGPSTMAYDEHGAAGAQTQPQEC